jgi:hypothetical protein
MSDAAWKRLVKRYADGRTVCNCGHAYYTPCGDAFTFQDGRIIGRTDKAMVCQYGCQANQYSTKLKIAAKVEAELPKDQAHAA